jgi:hypothetical protein
MRSLLRLLQFLVTLTMVVLFALFVWPTQWRYDHLTVDGDTYPVRIHRLTGHAWVLLPGDGWTPAEDVETGGDQGPEAAPGTKT